VYFVSKNFCGGWRRLISMGLLRQRSGIRALPFMGHPFIGKDDFTSPLRWL
jgi:hypothetical protein